MQEISFYCSPEQAVDEAYLKSTIAQKLKITSEFNYIWHKRSFDARKKTIKVRCSFHVYIGGEKLPEIYKPLFPKLKSNKKIHIIGLGPAGLFAALAALEQGIKPIVYERGKAVKDRIKDIGKLNRKGIVNEDSNYCLEKVAQELILMESFIHVQKKEAQ